MSKSDITNNKDIVLLVDTFYSKVRNSNTLNFIFTDVAQIDWKTHLPRMYSFWSSILLGEQTFKGNPMLKHINLSRKTAMTSTQFKEWLLLFNSTVDELFVGDTANEAKLKAANIAGLMLYKIETV